MDSTSMITCPNCMSKSILKKGYRKNKMEKTPKYYCKGCGRYFVGRKMLNKSYPANVILTAISLYNKGMTLEQASLEINKRFHVKTYPKLISTWLKEFSKVCAFRRIRGKIREGRKSGFPNPVLEKLFDHKQPYLYKCHKLKLGMFLTEYYLGLKEYLLNVQSICPNDLFIDDNARGSRIQFCHNTPILKKKNFACELAGLALKMAKTNRERHGIIQDFMLANDTSTIAVEVPVWLSKEEVKRLDSEFNVFGFDSCITGHIDLVQARFGIIYLLDYKPGAEKVDAVSQLFTYALALSERTGVWLRNFRCAWLDESVYYEFNPNEIILMNLEKKFGRVPEAYLRKFVLDEKAKRYFTSKSFHEKRGGL
ncbi:MAG TPA: hypothetical protein VFF28_05070 [Candidatus Nanoarchaeia archaeon]|nr:hypothetical protein [Candidatus Nanoarchaeia archaeon]